MLAGAVVDPTEEEEEKVGTMGYPIGAPGTPPGGATSGIGVGFGQAPQPFQIGGTAAQSGVAIEDAFGEPIGEETDFATLEAALPGTAASSRTPAEQAAMIVESAKGSFTDIGPTQAIPAAIGMMGPLGGGALFGALMGMIGKGEPVDVQSIMAAYNVTEPEAQSILAGTQAAKQMEIEQETPFMERGQQAQAARAVEAGLAAIPSATIVEAAQMGNFGMPEAPGFGPDPDAVAAAAAFPDSPPADIGFAETAALSTAPTGFDIGAELGMTSAIDPTAPPAAGAFGTGVSAPSAPTGGLTGAPGLPAAGPAPSVATGLGAIAAPAQAQNIELDIDPITTLALAASTQAESQSQDPNAFNAAASALVGFDVTNAEFSAIQEAESAAGFSGGWDPEAPEGQMGWGGPAGTADTLILQAV